MANKVALASNGPKSGKSTLARYLHDHYGYRIADHSLTVVQRYVLFYNDLYGDSLPTPLTVEDVYANKEAHRKGLQEVSDILGFTHKDTAAVWIEETLRRVPEGAEQPVVFDPIRGNEQAENLKRRGFVIVSLFIDESERARRCSSSEEFAYITAAINRRPDIEGPIALPDIRLNGELPVEKMARVLSGYPNTEELYPHGRITSTH